MMQKTTRNIGQTTETACCSYLQQQGLKLIEKNFHSRYGEIDLIMKERDTLIFIEVRYRKNDDYGGAIASVTPAKQRKVRATAEYYLLIKSIKSNARIDVVAMTQDIQSRSGYSYNWIKDAF